MADCLYDDLLLRLLIFMEMKDYVKKTIFIALCIYSIIITMLYSVTVSSRPAVEGSGELDYYRQQYEQSISTLEQCRNEIGSIREELDGNADGILEIASRLRKIAEGVANLENIIDSWDNSCSDSWDDSSHNEKAVNENAEE